jgi:DNA-binding NarL/FixJ family response regulator
VTTVRVLMADDQAMVRQGFTVLLGAEPGIEETAASPGRGGGDVPRSWC